MEQHVARPEVRESRGGLIAAILFVVAYFVARVVLKVDDVGASLRVLAALLPVAPFSWMLWEIAIKPPSEDLSYRHVWAIVPVFYYAGLVLARRRYR